MMISNLTVYIYTIRRYGLYEYIIIQFRETSRRMMKVSFHLKGHYKFIVHEERHGYYKTVLEEKTN
jgi:hypothetical protein